MERIVDAKQLKTDVYNIINETADNHIPILITSEKNNAVLISEEDFGVQPHDQAQALVPEELSNLFLAYSRSAHALNTSK